MDHRTLLLSSAAILAAGLASSPAALGCKNPNETAWTVRTSEGFDAIAFLGPLSGAGCYLSVGERATYDRLLR
jgi:hypothetical protein